MLSKLNPQAYIKRFLLLLSTHHEQQTNLSSVSLSPVSLICLHRGNPCVSPIPPSSLSLCLSQTCHVTIKRKFPVRAPSPDSYLLPHAHSCFSFSRTLDAFLFSLSLSPLSLCSIHPNVSFPISTPDSVC